MKKYLISFTVLSVFLLLVFQLRGSLPFALHQQFGNMLLFFTAQSVIIAVVLYFAEKKQEYYGLFALGVVVLRLLTAIIFLMIMYVSGIEDAMGFAIQFMLLYLSYLVFELTVVLSNLRRN